MMAYGAGFQPFLGDGIIAPDGVFRKDRAIDLQSLGKGRAESLRD